MLFYKVLIWLVCVTAIAHCEECIFDLKLKGTQDIRFDLTRIQEHTVNDNNLNSVKFKLCKINNQQKPTYCNGIISKICLIKNKVQEIDIGSRIKEIKLDTKNHLFMSLEGNTTCEKNQKYKTEITFVCNKNISTDKVIFKRHSDNNCKYIVEWTSVAVCPVDGLDIWKVCEVLLPHSNYKINLNPLRRINNYLVENHNRRFEVNICGRLNDNNKCGGNITTICDITDITNPKVYAVGFRNDELYFDTESDRLKLIQHERATKNKKGRRIEFVFKCNESVTPEKTKPEFLYDQNYISIKNDPNIAHFEVATSTVCLPRMISCEIFTKTANFNLKPLHRRKGNFRINSDLIGGHFYINVCDYLNEYNEEIPASCTGAGKTSACYVDSSGKAISVGSSQIGPYRVGNSILLNYTEGETCKNSRKWSTMVNFTCSDESQLKHISSNTSLCIHVLEWKTREACRVLLERKDLCMVTHPMYPKTVYDMSSFKNHKDFEVENEDNLKLRFSICKPLDSPCNNSLDSAACLLFNGKEINLGLFTQQIVFENGKIYMAMQGEKCVDFGPISSTIIRFVCDYSDSKHIDYKMELKDCTFEIIVYTKNACSSASKVNCTVVGDTMKLQNTYDLSQLTKFNSNYEISISSKEKIIFNVCHSVINNDINGANCQFSSGICLVDRNHLSYVDWYKNLGDVSKSPYKVGNKIVLDMPYGFYNGHYVSSRIEFLCSSQSVYPFLVNISKIDNKYTYIIKWQTPLVCSTSKYKRESSVDFLKTSKVHQKKPNYNVSINGLTYNTFLYSKNDTEAVSDVANGNVMRKVVLTEEDQELEYTLTQKFSFIHNSSVSCRKNINDKEKIVFHFICGFELQKPKIEKNLNKPCTTDVLNIDPDICDHKLECKTSLYDLTPIKGSYITMGNYSKYGKTKFYINLCTPGEGGIGGLMELNGKNYSIGYQESLPKDEGNTVEVIFEHGAFCSNNLFLPLKYSTKITFQCDSNEAKGYPLHQNSNDKCTLHFLWKTSLLCHKKLVEFNSISCTASLKDYNKGFENIKVLNMENILNTYKFLDKSTTTNYQVNLCKPSVCLYESSNCSYSMKLYYDVVKKHLIASFDHFNYLSNLKSMEIVIECSELHEDNLLTDQNMLLTDQTLIFFTYSKRVCCMDFTDLTNEEMCKNYLLPSISPIIIENTKVEDLKNYKSNLLNVSIVYLNNSDPEDSILSNTSYTKSETYIGDNNSTLQWNNPIKVKQVVEEYPIYTSGTVLLLATFITLVLSFLWFYRCMILKKIRQYLYPSSSVS